MAKCLITNSMTRRRLIGTTSIAGGGLLLTALPVPRAFGQVPAVKLGQIAPFTGSAAEFGEFYRDAVALGVEQINTGAEEVFGGPIISEHIAEDTNTLPTPAIESARKLVEADGVIAIIGGWSSGVTVATSTSVSIPAGVPQISNGSTSPLISVLPEDEQTDLLFRTTSSDALQGVVAAQLANGEIFPDYKFGSAATIYVNNPYGQGLSNAFARSFELRGGKVQAQVPHPEEVQPTYRAQLSEALKDEPELLLAASYPAHTAAFLKEARDVFGMTDWQFVDGNKSTAVLDAVGAESLEGKIGTAPGQDSSIPGFKNFSEAFKQSTGRDRIPPFTESAYDAAIVIGLAIAKAIADGETEITGIKVRDRLRDVANPPGEQIVGGSAENIRQALQLIKDGQDVDYSGAAGATDFDAAGDVITPIEIWKFEGGDIQSIQIQSAEEIPEE